MNVLYSSDNNYARHVGIAITSLYDHNQTVEQLDVYLIDDGIDDTNKAHLNDIALKYNRTINYIPFEPYKKQLQLNNKWELPISAYARLFVEDIVPKNVDKILYLDCDTLIMDNLSELWNLDLQGNTIAAVEDVASCVFQSETDTCEPYRYFCSGVILIDLKKWRLINAQQKLLDYIDFKKGVVRHHDQTILNGVFWNDCYMLHPKYDVLTPTVIMSYDNLKTYFKLWDRYYTKKEIKESTKKPAIIHYTSSNIGRPWENKKHPLSKFYRKYWKNSAWKDVPMGSFTPTYDKIQQRTYLLYQKVPYFIIKNLFRFKNIKNS